MIEEKIEGYLIIDKEKAGLKYMAICAMMSEMLDIDIQDIDAGVERWMADSQFEEEFDSKGLH